MAYWSKWNHWYLENGHRSTIIIGCSWILASFYNYNYSQNKIIGLMHHYQRLYSSIISVTGQLEINWIWIGLFPFWYIFNIGLSRGLYYLNLAMLDFSFTTDVLWIRFIFWRCQTEPNCFGLFFVLLYPSLAFLSLSIRRKLRSLILSLYSMSVNSSIAKSLI